MAKVIAIIKQLAQHRSVVCLNGELPSAQVLLKLGLPIIAVDGASKQLKLLGVIPALIIGDLDSDDPALFPAVKRVKTPDQDFSDFQKTLHHLQQQKLLPGIVCGVGGGYLDHILFNVAVLSQSSSVMCTDSQVGFVLDSTKELVLPRQTKISIFGAPEAKMNSKGLKWELQQTKLQLFGFSSLSNRTVSDKISLEVVSGRALVIMYAEEVVDAGYFQNK